MKKFAIAAMLLSATTVAMADLADSYMLDEDDLLYCGEAQKMAREVMTERQSGVPIVDAIKASQKEKDEHWKSLRAALVAEAYESPVFSKSLLELVNSNKELPVLPESIREMIISNYENKIGTECIEALIYDKTHPEEDDNNQDDIYEEDEDA